MVSLLNRIDENNISYIGYLDTITKLCVMCIMKETTARILYLVLTPVSLSSIQDLVRIVPLTVGQLLRTL